MKAFLVCMNAGTPCTETHEVVVAECIQDAEEWGNESLANHAESYGIYQGEDGWEDEEGEESDYDPESYVVLEIYSEGSLEEADEHRCGGGSFRKELERDGFVL